jgi:hypothetical protein
MVLGDHIRCKNRLRSSTSAPIYLLGIVSEHMIVEHRSSIGLSNVGAGTYCFGSVSAESLKEAIFLGYGFSLPYFDQFMGIYGR